MSHQVPWSKFILEHFVEEAALTKTEEMIIRTRVKGWSRQEQAMKLGMSLSTVDRCIATLKKKYDRIQKTDPLLPPRKPSAKETWMDEN